MNEKTYDRGVDFFRIIAALLVIMIHTAPLQSYDATADFIVTRIIARVAVPFFFVTSGYYLFSHYGNREAAFKQLVNKNLQLYGIAIILYLPINLYQGYFKGDHVLIRILKDMIFNGTLYHLWFFPALVIGAFVSVYLADHIGYQKAFIISIILYMIGLFGDSYYGIAEHIPIIRSIYDDLFQLFDYTRNGLFFAPVYLLMGAGLAGRWKIKKKATARVGMMCALSLMIVEGLILHHFELQRHDSMYIMLVPCVYYLFSYILSFKGKRLRSIRNIALIVYIIHPLMILVVRGAAKVTGTKNMLIDNSLLHFLAVSILSILVAMIVDRIIGRCNRNGKKKAPKDRAWLEINLTNLKHNVQEMKKLMPSKCRIMAVVKAEAYGHGSIGICRYLNHLGITSFAVATIDEGITLRKSGIEGEILILGYTQPSRVKELKRFHLMATVTDIEQARLLNDIGCNITVHIKIDTGMHRLGFPSVNTSEVAEVFRMKHLTVCGIYTHFCVSDSQEEEDIAFTHIQKDAFYNLLGELKKQGIKLPKIHMQCSSGLLNYPEFQCDYVRIGIGMYGTLSSLHDRTKQDIDLRSVLSLRSRITHLTQIPAGERVGYGRDFLAKRITRIAVVSIGFADGIPRNLSWKNCSVLVQGRYAPIAGRICMDQMMIDVTDIPDAAVGSVVTLVGKDGQEEIKITELAELADSITNELLSRMGRRFSFLYC